MKFKNKQEKTLYNLLFRIKSYAVFMDFYFSNENNIENNKDLYKQYKEFSNDLIKIFIDLGVVKKWIY